MVVPRERVSRTEKYIGNKLILNITKNTRILNVTGNDCKINISENTGMVKVIGCQCEVTVLNGFGNIEYVGNCGKIYLGADVPRETVTYIGNEGRIFSVGDGDDSKKSSSAAKEEVQRTFTKKVNISNSNMVRIGTCCGPDIIQFSVSSLRGNGRKECRKN